jgi:K+-sensing histidine kinase KdpD
MSHPTIHQAEKADGVQAPSSTVVRRRRIELLALAIAVVATTGAVFAFSQVTLAEETSTGVSPSMLRWPAILLALAFGLYAVEKEIHFRRLQSQLRDERGLAAAYSIRLREASVLAAASQALGSTVDLEQAADVVLEQALALFESQEGSVLLLDRSGQLRSASARGNERARTALQGRGRGVAGHVALTGKSLLLNGPPGDVLLAELIERDRPVESAMSVPLVNRRELIGVLNVNAPKGRLYEERDLRLLEDFARGAATALANAKLFAAQKEHLAELAEVGRLKGQALEQRSRELKAEADQVRATIARLRAPDLPEPARLSLLDTLDRRARQLVQIVEASLSSSALEEGNTTPITQPVDLASVVVAVAAENRLAGRAVELTPIPDCTVLADPALLEQVLWNLVSETHDHGQPPVLVSVDVRAEAAVISVADTHQRTADPSSFRGLDPTAAAELGLAIAIARQIVESWDGDISVPASGLHAFQVRLRQGTNTRT